MTTVGQVKRIAGPGSADVTVARETACGHDCERCAGCGAQSGSITVTARAAFPVEPGDRVELFSDNRVLGYAALVYLLPVALFFAGYLALPGLGESLRCLCGGVGFALGIGAAVLCDRRAKRRGSVTYEIIRKL